MNDILIVGNGYDLAKGLNTRFSDFFLQIVRQYVIWLENDFNNQNLAPDIQKYCYVLKQKIPHLPDVVVKNEDEFFNNIFIQIVLNKFFPIVNLLNSVLRINDQLYDATVSTVLSEGIAYSPYNDNRDIKFIVTSIREVCSLLQDNIISSDIFWLDIESLIKDIVTDNLTKYPVNSDININWNLLYETVNRIESKTNLTKNKTEDLKKYKHVSLSECLLGLDMFKELFCEYLEIEENKYKSGKLKEIYLKDKFSHVISLNYTSTFMDSLKRSVPYKRQEDRICYVHGDRISKNIVIGTESFYFEENSRSETNIEKNPFFKLTLSSKF